MITWTTSAGNEIKFDGLTVSIPAAKRTFTILTKNLDIEGGYLFLTRGEKASTKVEIPSNIIDAAKALRTAALNKTVADTQVELDNDFGHQMDRLMSGKSNRLGVAH